MLKFLRNEKAFTAIEYGIAIALLAIAAIAAITAFLPS